MGFDSYCISGATGYGIMVPNKHIKELRQPGSSNTQTQHMDELDGGTFRWLFESFPDHRLYAIHDAFVFLAKEEMTLTPTDEVCCPNDMESENFHRFRCNIQTRSNHRDELDADLVRIARSLTPATVRKLRFPPGSYSFLSLLGDDTIQKIEPTNSKFGWSAATVVMPLAVSSGKPAAGDAGAESDGDLWFHRDCHHLLDVKLAFVDGGGSFEHPSLRSNRSLLSARLPKFDEFIAAHGQVRTSQDGIAEVVIPSSILDPAAVQAVLEYFTTRKPDAALPDRWIQPKAYGSVMRAMAEFGIPSPHPGAPKAIAGVGAHSTLTAQPPDETVTFVTNPDEVHASRVILGLMNPILHRILYPTRNVRNNTNDDNEDDRRNDDLPQRIDWQHYATQAVRCVLSALLLGRANQASTVVPLEWIDSAKELLNFLNETKESLDLEFETFYEEQYRSGFAMTLDYSENAGTCDFKSIHDDEEDRNNAG